MCRGLVILGPTVTRTTPKCQAPRNKTPQPRHKTHTDPAKTSPDPHKYAQPP
jgi:hypothetical protein